MSWTKEEIHKLRGNITDKMRDQLANEFNIKRRSLTNILGGHSNNEEVIIRAAELVLEHRTELERSKQAIDAI